MTRIAASLLLAAALAAGASAGIPGAGADVRTLARDLESIHPDLFHAVTRARFAQQTDSLAGRAPGLGRDQLLVGLMRLAALAGARDGHTGIFPRDPSHRTQLHLFPLRLYDFPEGLVVVGSIGAPRLVGARLVAVNGTPVATVAARVRPLVPHDNAWSLRARLTEYLLVAEVLHGVGVAPRVGPLRFTFARPGGGRFETTLRPVGAERYTRAFPDLWHPMIPTTLPQRPRPLYLARRNRTTWTTTLNGGRAVYLAYNRTTVDTGPIARRLLQLASSPRVERVVVDLRHNPGGNVFTSTSLLQALRDRRIDRPNRLVVLLGRGTFSAAALLAAELDRTTRAVFVGEPSGGSPNLYGDPQAVSLPATGWSANVATRYWVRAAPADRRLAIRPDVTVVPTAADFRAGRDPVLATALGAR